MLLSLKDSYLCCYQNVLSEAFTQEIVMLVVLNLLESFFSLSRASIDVVDLNSKKFPFIILKFQLLFHIINMILSIEQTSKNS